MVACHCGLYGCAGGFIGVDLFFVLSGYLITGLLVAELRATSRIDLPRFFARRARRLLPACALVLLMTTLAAAAVLSPLDIAATGDAARAAALYVSNVFFDRSAADYFAPHVEGNPLLHTWSLGVEEQFYLLWPLLILLASRGSHRLWRLVWILGTVITLSLLCSVYATPRWPTFAFYELPPRAWEFAAGGLLATLPVSGARVSTGGAVAVGIVGLVVILGTTLLLHGGAGFPGSVALLPVTGTLAMLFAGTKAPSRGVSALLSSVPLQFLGARSYSWYLWHWPFVVFAGLLFPGINAGGKVAAAVLSLLIAHMTFIYLERPVRESRFLSTRTWLSLSSAAGAILLTVAASWGLLIFGRQQLILDEKFRGIGAAAMDVADISPHDCWSQGRFFDVKVCEFGTPATAPALVLFGDSHALQWVNPLRSATSLEAWRLITVLRPGCTASDIIFSDLPLANRNCKEWRDQAIEKILALHPAAIAMASFNGAGKRGDATEPTVIPADAVQAGTRRTLQRLASAGVPIVILRDSPTPPFNVPGCVSQRLGGKRRADQCDFDAVSALNAPAAAAEHAAAAGMNHVYFLDMDDLICPGSSCPATRGEMLIYRDQDHLTGTFARSLAPMLRTRLFGILRNARAADGLSTSSFAERRSLAVSPLEQAGANDAAAAKPN